MNPKHREIKPVDVVAGFLSRRRGKVLLKVRLVALSAGQPAGYDMIGGAFAVRRRHVFQSFPGDIELAKTKRGGSEVQLAVEILRLEPGDLPPPGHSLGPVLFLARLRQDLKGGKRIRTLPHNLLRRQRCPIEVLLRDNQGRTSVMTFADANAVSEDGGID